MKRIPASFWVVLPALLLGLTGCAFFNTLYNGWEAYDEAWSREEQMILEGSDTADIHEQTEDKYRRAFNKAEKAVNYYPRSTRHHDEAYYLRGLSAFRLGEYSQAINAFNTLRSDFPDSEHVPLSWFYSARAHHAKGDYEKARELYTFILETYPELNEDNRVTLQLAELAAADQGRGAAVRMLEKAYENAAGAYERIRLINRISEYYADLELWEKALSWLKKSPAYDKDYADSYYAVTMRHVQVLRRLERYSDGLELLESLMERGEFFRHGTKMNFEKGELLFALKRYDEAYDLFSDITARKDRDEYDVIGRSWLNMAEISIDIRSDLETGVEELRQARRFLSGELQDTAARRLAGLQDVLASRDSLASLPDTAEAHRLRYRIGEAFWLDGGLPDSALSNFDTLLADTSVSDSLRRVTLYSKAWIYRSLKNDTARSDSIFEHIIDSYPASRAAKEAQEILGREVTVVTRSDSAKACFRDAEKRAEKQEGYSKNAYYRYLVCAGRYKDVEEIAAKSLYAAGREAAERPGGAEGTVDTAAAKVFSRLCERYPESDYCRESRQLMTMGAVKNYLREYEERRDLQEEMDSVSAEQERQEAADTEPESYEIPAFRNWF
ncbi:MAG: tetratricopeptide repeat protein [Fibrobacterota bacterium]